MPGSIIICAAESSNEQFRQPPEFGDLLAKNTNLEKLELICIRRNPRFFQNLVRPSIFSKPGCVFTCLFNQNQKTLPPNLESLKCHPLTSAEAVTHLFKSIAKCPCLRELPKLVSLL